MKICLAASGGGHLRQIAQLKPFFERHETFLVTQQTPLGIALSNEIRTYFIPDIALGKIKKVPREWITFAKNLLQSYRILRKEKPDLIISTGAGLTFNLLWLSRPFSIRSIFIESIAHVYTPTATGRMMRNRVDAYLVQWEDLHRQHPKSILACPIQSTGEKLSLRGEGGTFVTVGTHGPFPRLIEGVDRLAAEGKLPRPIAVQHPGETKCPHADQRFESCSSAEFEEHLKKASLVLTHAGTGSIFSALEARRPVIALPRLAEYGEHYDDHQKEILKKLTELGAILGGETLEDLERNLNVLKTFEPNEIRYDSSVIVGKIEELVAGWFRAH
jgi:UDP-N-acetylglucosamine transferase subunit ALG13